MLCWLKWSRCERWTSPLTRVVIFDVVWNSSGQYLVHQNAERIPINGKSIRVAANLFRGHVVVRAAGWSGATIQKTNVFRQAKVSQLDVTGGCQEHIFGLQITIDNLRMMYDRESPRDLNQILDRVFVFHGLLTDQEHTISAQVYNSYGWGE